MKAASKIFSKLFRFSLKELASNVWRLLDADVAIESRWEALKNVLHTSGYISIPDVPDVNGTVLFEEGLPKFGAWIMPNNLLSGMLEDFIAFLVPKGDQQYRWPGR